MKNSQISNLLPVLVLPSLILHISGSLSHSPVLTGPDMAFLGSRVSFQCQARNSSPPVTYELKKDTNRLIGTDIISQGDQLATFSFKVTVTSEGSYHCKATTGGDTRDSNSIRLLVVIPVSGTRLTSDPYPPVLYEGSRLVLSCDVTRGSHLSYTWYFNRKEVTSSTLPSLRPTGKKLVVEKVTPKHAGNYYCMVGTKVKENDRFSNSDEVQVIVKAYFSTPRISFTISKEGTSYSGNVTCWSPRGSPPVTFYLLVDDKEVDSVVTTQSMVAWFPVAMVPGRDMGVARCRVKSEVQQLMSEPLTLEVVPVGGGAKVEVEYLYRADSKMAAARLHCHLSRGTFPSFSWLVNNSLLPTQTHAHSHPQPLSPHYALADGTRTLMLTNLSPRDSGYYRCRVRDSYDDSSPWMESADVLVQVADQTGTLSPCSEHLPTSSIATPPKATITSIEAISIVFCCFLFLSLVGAVAIVMIKFHQQAHVGVNATTDSNPLPLSPIASESQDKQDTSSIDSDVQNQTMEITI